MNLNNYKLLAWVAVVSLILLIALYVVEFDYIENTIGFEGLIWKSIGSALMAGSYLGWRFQKKGKEQVDRIRIWSACLLFPLFFAPLLGSLSNRLVSRTDFEEKSFEFLEEKAFAASAYGFLQGEKVEPDGCYLFVYYEGEIHRLKRNTCSFLDKKRGDEVKLRVSKGLWGYEIVDQN